MNKVLFISYYWPPSGKASLHWPLKMVQHLPSFEWMPLVLTAEEDTFSQKDDTFLNEIPAEVNVLRAKSYEPFDLYKKVTGKGKNEQLIASETISKKNNSKRRIAHRLSIWIRMNLFIPDARVGWYFPAIKTGSNLLTNEKINAIVSIGPPHTTHLIGKKLSSKFGIPHVPVFIDPWVDISYYRNFKRNRITFKIDNHLESSVLHNAAQIVFVTETMQQDYEKKYPFIKSKSNVLFWGYSEEDFSMQPAQPITKDENLKVILHSGNIFDYQNPNKFWQKIKMEIDKGNKLKLVFIGTVSPEIKQAIKNSGLDSHTEYKGFLPYKEMLIEMMNASYLLVCATEPRHVPGKLFEYLRAGKPIIAFGDGNKEVKKILEDSNAGKMYSYNESGEEFFNICESFKTNREIIRGFERGNIAKQFAILLNKV